MGQNVWLKSGNHDNQRGNNMAPNPSIYDIDQHRAAYLRAVNNDDFAGPTTADDEYDDIYHPAYRAAYDQSRNNHPANHRNRPRTL
jgi:hypothetical protein